MHVAKLDQLVCIKEIFFYWKFYFCILGEAIKRITCVESDTFGKPVCITDRQSMIHAARSLLSAVTRVLLLADMVVVKQIISVKKKVWMFIWNQRFYFYIL